MNKRGQAWIIDLFAGILIFLIGFVLLLKSTVNVDETHEETVKNLKLEGNLISDMLLSSGSPTDWNASDVIQIGLADSGRINTTKLGNYSLLDYNTTKTMFRTQFEYVFFFENASQTISVNGQEHFGYDLDPELITATLEPTHMHRIVRLTVVNSEIVRMVVYLWR